MEQNRRIYHLSSIYSPFSPFPFLEILLQPQNAENERILEREKIFFGSLKIEFNED
jgi:hypothetical protein